MEKLNMGTEIIESLKNLNNGFQEDDLSLLAITSKVELPFRDALLLSLNRKLSKKGIISTKEWKRTDLALIEDNEPLALIELKAMYSFDSFINTRGNFKDEKFFSEMRSDKIKARKLANDKTEVYTLLTVTHPHQIIEDSNPGSTAVKYRKSINRRLRLNTREEILELADARIVNELEKFGDIVHSGVMDAGTTFDTDVSIMVYLVKC